MWVNHEHEPRWEGPPMKWCNASVRSDRVRFQGEPLIVVCSRVLREDGTCPGAHNHVARPMCAMATDYGGGLPERCHTPLDADGTCPNEFTHTTVGGSPFEAHE